MLVAVPQAGQVGVNRDLSIPNLPNNAWTNALNVRFQDGYAIPFAGHAPLFQGNPVTALHVLPISLAGVRSWMYAGTQKIYLAQTIGGVTTHTNLTRQTASVDVNYTGTPNAWTSTILGGVPVLNNGIDPPQQWLLAPGTRCAALSAWPANTTCRVMRAYKNSLIALGVTKSGVEYPYMVKWSHPADPGAVPVTWDITDPTKDAGEFDLSDGYDRIVDGLPLRSSFMIYKESSIWRMDFTGGVYVYSWNKVLGTSGAMNRNCIVEIDGQHLVLTGSDVIVHDGQAATSILDKQTRRDLFSRINTLNQGACFVFKNPFFREVFICFPEGADTTVPNRALVWNWMDRTVTFRELPNINHAAPGPIPFLISDSWGADTASWGDDLTSWNQTEYSPDRDRVLMATTSLQMLDNTPKFDGVLPTYTLERIGLAFGKPEVMKTARGIRPLISGPEGTTVTVQLGAANDQYTAPTWSAPMTFTIGAGVPQCDTFVTGRYLSVRFAGGTANTWRLDGYQIDVTERGAW